MTDFIIPKGSDFSFTIKVIEHDSFIAQDLTNMTAATLKIIKTVDQCTILTTTMSVTDAINGMLEGTILAADTDLLEVVRGAPEDGFYLKAAYQGVINITFSDATLPISVVVEKVFVSSTGIVCV